MPSEDDETTYSMFGNDAANELGRPADDDRVDPDAAGLGDGEDGCPKCGDTETETDEIATSGTGLTKMFDVQNRKFVVVSCAECGYSELYKGQSSGNAIDFFLG
ncbi:zinc ribbon domain-containing protein [Halorubrum trapanicum]|uniref:zinc ribbon domain-containing protein n=1 Tax=Halorubrum trapanicum TaxID=29284 RepID=UPI000BBA4321|nr:zinc ribbon domain-containing protein [Halorubrum trapanicum]